MLQLWIISLVAAVYLHDELRLRGGGGVGAGAVEVSGWRIAAAVAPFVVIALVTHLVCWACGKELDRRGSGRAVDTAERMLAASRMLAVLTYVTAIFSTVDWVGQVRAVVGDLIAVDELIVMLPPLVTFAAGWCSFYPIERRLREAVWVRVLEEGQPAYPTPTRWQFVWSNVRHQVLFILLPLVLIMGWTEAWGRVLEWLIHHQLASGLIGRLGSWAAGSREAARVGGQLVGVAAVFVFSPVLMRVVWDAVPLALGALRDRLMGVCTRAGVKVRELLVWRTHGTMLNGAAMGLVAPLRYILLTDALLDNLQEREVESVMAHEVAHAKHNHIPWMIGGMMASLGLAGVLMTVVISLAVLCLWGFSGSFRVPVLALDAAQGVGSVLAFVLGFGAFGWISRRFEWQADAFAARELSKQESSPIVTPGAAEAMCGALESVARLNHINPARRSFRHGSIRLRQARLRRLVGTPVERARIDVLVRWIKGGILVGVLMTIATVVLAGPEARRGGVHEPAWAREGLRYRLYDHGWPQCTLEDAP